MIWCEHLDSLGEEEDAVRRKLTADMAVLARPSSASLAVVVLDETRVSEALCRMVADAFLHQVKHLKKVAFVGMSAGEARLMKKALQGESLPFAMIFLDDLEKAKEWLVQ